MRIDCSNCGTHYRFKYSAANVLKAIELGWNSCGSALYCPDCTKTWKERNGNRPLAGRKNTIRVIDEWAERQEVV